MQPSTLGGVNIGGFSCATCRRVVSPTWAADAATTRRYTRSRRAADKLSAGSISDLRNLVCARSRSPAARRCASTSSCATSTRPRARQNDAPNLASYLAPPRGDESSACHHWLLPMHVGALCPSYGKATKRALRSAHGSGCVAAGLLCWFWHPARSVTLALLRRKYCSGSYSMPSRLRSESITCARVCSPSNVAMGLCTTKVQAWRSPSALARNSRTSSAHCSCCPPPRFQPRNGSGGNARGLDCSLRTNRPPMGQPTRRTWCNEARSHG
jgi:hypothetical protein